MIWHNRTLPTSRCHVKFCYRGIFDDSAKQRNATNNGFKRENKQASVILLILSLPSPTKVLPSRSSTFTYTRNTSPLMLPKASTSSSSLENVIISLSQSVGKEKQIKREKLLQRSALYAGLNKEHVCPPERTLTWKFSLSYNFG